MAFQAEHFEKVEDRTQVEVQTLAEAERPKEGSSVAKGVG